MFYTYIDLESENSNEKEDLLREPAAEEMGKGNFPTGASMPVTDLYRRKHKTDSKSVTFMDFPLSSSQCDEHPKSNNKCFYKFPPPDNEQAIIARFYLMIMSD